MKKQAEQELSKKHDSSFESGNFINIFKQKIHINQ